MLAQEHVRADMADAEMEASLMGLVSCKLPAENSVRFPAQMGNFLYTADKHQCFTKENLPRK